MRPFNASSRGGTDADSTVKLASSKGEAHRDYKFESVLETSRDWLRDASQDYAGDLKQVAQLKRLVSLFQSRARFYRWVTHGCGSVRMPVAALHDAQNLLYLTLRSQAPGRSAGISREALGLPRNSTEFARVRRH